MSENVFTLPKVSVEKRKINQQRFMMYGIFISRLCLLWVEYFFLSFFLLLSFSMKIFHSLKQKAEFMRLIRRNCSLYSLLYGEC